jgi:hypothetical protein
MTADLRYRLARLDNASWRVLLQNVSLLQRASFDVLAGHVTDNPVGMTVVFVGSVSRTEGSGAVFNVDPGGGNEYIQCVVSLPAGAYWPIGSKRAVIGTIVARNNRGSSVVPWQSEAR